jgi:ecotin
MRISGLCATLALFVPLAVSAASVSDDMEAYPPPEAGVVRTAFRLPAVENEQDRKVEILVGKTLLIDCNSAWFGGDLERRVAEGWGYPYSVLETVGGLASTRMACPPDEAQREAFVSVRGEGFLQPYNSKLPVVVYVPDGFEVRYRIWRAGDAIGRAEHR